MGDAVDEICQQWNDERPDLDVAAMGLLGRLTRVQRHVADRLNTVFAAHGLERWEFDVMATLRRNGVDRRLTAGELVTSMMITSGATTNRIDRLEARGLVERVRSDDDGRVRLISLTPEGRRLIDAAVTDHVANEQAVVAELDDDDRDALDDGLRSWLAVLEPEAETVDG